MNKNILFVDDEIQILEGLRDSLRQHRRRWNMFFACGGEEAIAELNEREFDVVVSDIRMPMIGGVDVLEFAMKQQPEAVRIALTGYSDQENTIKLTSLAQRYLTKPCDVRELEEAISRDCGLIDAFDNPDVKYLAGSAGTLPGNQENAQALMDALNETDSSVDDIANIVQRDLALTAKILQLVNSSFFRRQRKVESAKEAVAYLGMDIIRSMVLADQFFEMTQHVPENAHFSANKLFAHSLLTASIACRLTESNKLAAAAYTSGLLHDLGKIVITLEKPELLNGFAKAGVTEGWPDRETEMSLMGFTHGEIGGYFLNLWGIPTSIVEAVTFHDAPSSIFSREFDVVGAVHVANYLAHELQPEQTVFNPEAKLDMAYIDALGLAENLPEWREVAAEVLAELDSDNNSASQAA